MGDSKEMIRGLMQAGIWRHEMRYEMSRRLWAQNFVLRCLLPYREVRLVDEEGSAGLCLDIKLGVIFGGDSIAGGARGRAPVLIVGLLHIWESKTSAPLSASSRFESLSIGKTPRCLPAQHSTPPIRFVGMGVILFKHHPYHPFMLILGSPP